MKPVQLLTVRSRNVTRPARLVVIDRLAVVLPRGVSRRA
jgi:hypothetical protein